MPPPPTPPCRRVCRDPPHHPTTPPRPQAQPPTRSVTPYRQPHANPHLLPHQPNPTTNHPFPPPHPPPLPSPPPPAGRALVLACTDWFRTMSPQLRSSWSAFTVFTPSAMPLVRRLACAFPDAVLARHIKVGGGACRPVAKVTCHVVCKQPSRFHMFGCKGFAGAPRQGGGVVWGGGGGLGCGCSVSHTQAGRTPHCLGHAGLGRKGGREWQAVPATH